MLSEQKVRRFSVRGWEVMYNQLAASLVGDRLYFMGGNYSTVAYDGQQHGPCMFPGKSRLLAANDQ